MVWVLVCLERLDTYGASSGPITKNKMKRRKLQFLKLFKSSLRFKTHLPQKAGGGPTQKPKPKPKPPKQKPRSQWPNEIDRGQTMDLGQKNWIPVPHNHWEEPNAKRTAIICVSFLRRKTRNRRCFDVPFSKVNARHGPDCTVLHCVQLKVTARNPKLTRHSISLQGFTCWLFRPQIQFLKLTFFLHAVENYTQDGKLATSQHFTRLLPSTKSETKAVPHNNSSPTSTNTGVMVFTRFRP